MCGIFGYKLLDNSGVDPQQRAILGYALAGLNDNRGGQSWGFAYPDGNNVVVEKGLGKLVTQGHNIVKHQTVFAHSRWATHGKLSAENSHPFDIGNIVGAHNGVIHNHWDLKRRYIEREDFEVDSMHIFAHLNEGMPLDDLEGYGSIEWIQKDRPDIIYLCRLHNGDLTIFGVGPDPEHTRGVIWSSDNKHLEQALSHAGITDGFTYNISTGTVYCVTETGLYYAKMPKLELAKSNTPYRHWRDYTSGTYTGSNYSGGSSSSPKSAEPDGTFKGGGSRRKRPKNNRAGGGNDPESRMAEFIEVLIDEDDNEEEIKEKLDILKEYRSKDWDEWNQFCLSEDDENGYGYGTGYGATNNRTIVGKPNGGDLMVINGCLKQ